VRQKKLKKILDSKNTAKVVSLNCENGSFSFINTNCCARIFYPVSLATRYTCCAVY